MTTLKNMNDKQKAAVEKCIKDYGGMEKTDTDTQFITVGEAGEEPHLIIMNQGHLGTGFIERDGSSCWLNAIGEHTLLQFLIDKQYGANVVRNSKEIMAGRDD